MVTVPCPALDAVDRELVCAIEDGLPLVSRPYAEIASRLDLDEPTVRARVARLVQTGVVKRLGVVVRHRELGFTANAMVVWDVPDHQVARIGRAIARLDFVTLCYERPRRPPVWPYNLFCMIHGRDRDGVLARLGELNGRIEGLRGCRHSVLFGLRRFKQRGARYGRPGGGDSRTGGVHG